MEIKRETIQDLCNRESVTGQSVVSRGRFEGREGRAVTESERKSIPALCHREAEDI